MKKFSISSKTKFLIKALAIALFFSVSVISGLLVMQKVSMFFGFAIMIIAGFFACLIIPESDDI